MNMVKAVRIENVKINASYKIDEKGEDLFFVGEEGREREAIVIGLGKAKRLLQALNDDPEAFIDELRDYVHKREGKILAERSPVKTLTYGDSLYGLFADGAVKLQCEREGKAFWKAVKGRTAELITPEAFDNPESLSVPVKAPKQARTSKADEMAEMRANMVAMQAMVAQLLAVQQGAAVGV